MPEYTFPLYVMLLLLSLLVSSTYVPHVAIQLRVLRRNSRKFENKFPEPVNYTDDYLDNKDIRIHEAKYVINSIVNIHPERRFV